MRTLVAVHWIFSDSVFYSCDVVANLDLAARLARHYWRGLLCSLAPVVSVRWFFGALGRRSHGGRKARPRANYGKLRQVWQAWRRL